MSSSPDRGVSDGSVDPKLHPADRRAVFTAGISALFSTVMIAITAYFLYSSLDRRLALTTVEVFHEWGALRGVYERTVSYNPQFNPPTIHPRDSVRFDTGVHSLVVIKDLYERGLISYDVLNSTSARFNQSTGVLLSSPGVGGLDPRLIPQILLDFLTTKGQQTPGLPNSAMSTLVSAGLFNSSVDQTRVSRMLAELFTQANYTIPESYRNGWFMPEDPRILQRLLSAAGCTSPDALPGTTPITRSAGCQCIADTYLVFVRETVNMTSNVTWKARDAAAGDVLKCLDRRVVWHSWGAGRDRSVHPLGLALYGHCVCFLLCAAFLLSFYHFQIFPARWTAFERNLGIKIILAGVTSVFFIVFASHDFTANLFQLIGLILVLTNLIFSAHSILDYAGKGAGFRGGEEDQAKRVDPHPLTVCFWINVPVLLPAILGIVAISGFIRDFYAVLVVALIGALLGLVLQVCAPPPPACVLRYACSLFVFAANVLGLVVPGSQVHEMGGSPADRWFCGYFCRPQHHFGSVPKQSLRVQDLPRQPHSADFVGCSGFVPVAVV